MIKYIFLAFTALCCLCCSSVIAQDNPQLYKLHSPFERYRHNSITLKGVGAMPLGELSNEYIDQSSFKNFSIALEWIFPTSPFSAGIEISKAYFEKRLERDLYRSTDWDISAVQTRTLSLTPIQGFVRYNTAPVNATIQPYLQVNAGVTAVNYILYLGSLADQYQKLRLGYGAGIGSKILFKKQGKLGADVSVHYRGSSFNYGYLEKGASHLSGSVGIFYRWW